MMCCRRIQKIKRHALSFVYSEEPIVQHQQHILYTGGFEVPIPWQTIVPNHVIIAELIESISLDNVVRKYKVWHAGDLYIPPSDVQCNTLINTPYVTPWIWIGEDDNDMTNKLTPFLLAGNRITCELLEKLFPEIYIWTYMDSTLNIIDFPEEGITIECCPNSKLSDENAGVQK